MTTTRKRSFSIPVSVASALAVLAAAIGVTTIPADAAAGEISGMVFRDSNFDGAKAGELGEADVTITVTDTAGAQASATSNFDGTYAVPVSGLSGPFTVHFDIDPASTYLEHGPLGADNQGAIRFAADGAENVDFGVINPAHFCQDNPNVITNCYVEFDQISGPNSSGPVLVQTEYLASGDGTGGGTAEIPLTQASQIGTTFGLAIDNTGDANDANNLIYAAAYMKRLAGYGPDGPGAVYQLDGTGNVLNSFTLSAGTAPHDFTNVGGDVPDPASYAEVGKQSLGDIDLNEDSTRLYVVNMFDKTLYEIDVAGGAAASFATTNTWALTGLPGQTCTAGEIRPMAVGVNDGMVYVGTTCDAAGGSASDLVVHVHRMNPLGGGWQLVTSIPLDYARTTVGGGWGITAEWRPWNDVWVADVTGWGGAEVTNQQPILSDIEFDQGSLVLGIRDRYGDQSGYYSPSPNWPADSGLYATDSAGDTLRVCQTGPDTWAYEGQAGCEVTNGGDGGSGPGGVEWYDGDYYLTGGFQGHTEISLGGLASHRLRDEVIQTGYDTLDDNYGEYAFSNGLFRLDNTSGDKVGQYRVVSGEFGKAAGLGDMEMSCSASPTEIGNYVWLDIDADGIQDPDEPPLAGVVVTLSDGSTTTTDANGYYSFPVLTNTAYTITFDATGVSGVDGTKLVPTTQFATADPLSEVDSNLYDSGGTWTIDVAPILAAGDNDHSFDAGFFLPAQRIGNLIWLDENDNGLVDAGEPGVEGLIVELYQESGATAGFDGGDTLIASTITNVDGHYWFNQPDVGPEYYVAVPEDQSATTVLINGAAIDPATLLSSTGGDLTNNNTDNNDDAEPVTGFIAASGPADVSDNGEPLGETDGNTSADAEAALAAAGAPPTDDEDSNLTVDLGLVQMVRVGNLVWLDGATGEPGLNNSIADPAESGTPIGGATVEIYVDDDGTPGLSGADTLVDSTVTNAAGEYWFLVPAGTYVVAIPEGQTGQTVGATSIDLGTLQSSEPILAGADAGVDDEDDGEPITGYQSVSDPFVVNYGDNPTDESGHFSGGTGGEQEAAANAATGFHADNNSDLTIDFSFVDVPKYRLGNLIWLDTNDNGIAELGEDGIANVTVEVWADGGTAPVATTTTDAAGHYYFPDLAPGDYYIVVPAGQTGQTAGVNPVDLASLTVSSVIVADPDAAGDVDNDNNGSVVGSTNPVTTGVVSLGDPDPLVPTEPTDETLRSDDPTDDDPIDGTDIVLDNLSNLAVDIGFVQPVRVGNIVWLDDGGGLPGDPGYNPTLENNGIADVGESGIDGVLVQLLDPSGTVIAEATTANGGVYVFDGLQPGTYSVGIPDAQPTGALDATFSSTGKSATPETDDDDDDGEPAAGYLSISDPFDLARTTEATDERGDFSVANPGFAEDNVNTLTSFLPDDFSNLEVDFGFAPIPSYRIGNLIWEDLDRDGIADAGEPGIEGVLVQLLDDTATVIRETVTDADGHYAFDNLLVGDYQVQVPLGQTPVVDLSLTPIAGALDGLTGTAPVVAEPDDDFDNDHNGTDTGAAYLSDPLSVGEGSGNDEPLDETLRSDDATLDEDGTKRDDRSNLTVDIGLWRGLRLGNQVFRDGEQGDPGYDNGVFDAGEVGIASVPLELFIDVDADGIFEPGGDDGAAIATTVTDTEGNYWFDGLEPGVPYFVAVADLPTGLLSNVQSATALTADNDNDGGPDATYSAVSDVVILTIGGATTGEADTEPAEDAEAEANAAGATYIDGNSELAVDFGFIDIPLYRIGNLVWNDIDDDGLAETSEPGIEGVLVQLLDSTGTVAAETVTDASGFYAFENLLPGDYSVVIPADQTPVLGDQPNLIAGALDGFRSSDVGEEIDPNLDVDNNDNGIGPDAVTGNWVADTISLGPDPLDPPFGSEPVDETLRSDDATDDDPDAGLAGYYPDDQSNYSVDFGFYQLTLGNLVYFDVNDNGAFDSATEAGIADVTVNLLDGTGTVVDTTITDADGLYLFGGLEAGVDYVVEIADTNFATGGALEGMFSSTDPLAGPEDPDGDESTPGDGVDGDDSGVDPDYANGGLGDPVQSLPVTLFPADEPLVEDPNNDTQAYDGNGNLTVDFGFHSGGQIGSLVWLDDTHLTAEDENGIADTIEDGIPGVTVELFSDVGTTPDVFDGSDTLVATTVTGADGEYYFDNLAPGDYIVVIPDNQQAAGAPLEGLMSTVDGAGDETTDNDDDGTPIATTAAATSAFTITFGTAPLADGTSGTTGLSDDPGTHADQNSNLTADLGFVEVPTYRIGNLVWEDIDDDGLAETGEPGIEGVLVQLLDETGAVITETTTDVDGKYSFESLLAGDYSVVIPADQTPVLGAQAGLIAGALDGYRSSDVGEEVDPNADVDNNDNGIGTAAVEGEWASGPITVGEGLFDGEPADETLRSDDATDDDLDGPTGWPDDRSNYSVDFGFYPLTLGNLVWFDLNDNGLFDSATEAGIADVAVDLYQITTGGNVLVDSTVTDADGLYLFGGLENGAEYIVEVADTNFAAGAALEGMFSSTDPVGGPADPDGDEAVANDGVDGDDSGVDPDYLTGGSVGSGGEAVQSLPVLVNNGDEPLTEDPTNDTQATDGNGNLTVDFGFHSGGQIGSLVWLDDTHVTVEDENGIADAIEDGIDAVTVELYADDGAVPGTIDTNDSLVATTITAGGGLYSFDNLSPGDYIVVIPQDQLDAGGALEGLISTLDGPGDETTNNDDNGTTVGTVSGVGVATDVINITFGDEPIDDEVNGTTGTLDDPVDHANQNSNLTADLGFVEAPQYRIGNLVWQDVNDNGLAETGEAGIPGVLLQLLDGFGILQAETVTDADGKYAFEGLEAGTYTVLIPVEQAPALGDQADLDPLALQGMRSSDVGEENVPDDDVDNNDNGLREGSWSAAPITVGEGILGGEPTDETLRSDDATDDDLDGPTGWPDARSNYSIDFGFYPLSIGNQVWHDVNDNGTLDVGEVGLPDVEVNLIGETGTPLGVDVLETVVTDADGFYIFDSLESGADYIVEIADSNFAPGGALEGMFSSTDPLAGALDPDGDEATPGDGVDGDDSGVDPDYAAGVMTDPVQSLPVTPITLDEPTGETPSNDTHLVDASGNLTVDFGFHDGLRIGSLVWLDDTNGTIDDENGIADPIELGIGDVIVDLYADDGATVGAIDATDTLLESTVTNADGLYYFDGLVPGDYIVVIPDTEFAAAEPLEGLISTLDGSGDELTNNDDNGLTIDDAAGLAGVGVATDVFTLGFGDEPIDEDVNGTTGVIDEIPGAADQNSNLTADLGFVEIPLYRIGNLVWDDIDDDGLAETGEPGIEGVLVQLLDGPVDGGGVPIAETVTDVDGKYAFDGLLAGDYTVVVPVDQTPVVDQGLTPIPGVLDGYRSSDVGEEADPDADVDNNDNGILDSVDDGGTGDWVSGVITVGEGVLSGEPTDETLRSDDPTDDDLDGPTGWPDHRSNYSVDFGFYSLTLGNQVWFDNNDNGVFDAATEVGIADVTVNLYEDDPVDGLTFMESVITDADGLYLFDALVDGSTYVVEIPDANFAPGEPLENMFSTTDPDAGLPDPDGDEAVSNDGVDGDDSGVDPDYANGGAGESVFSQPVTLNTVDEPLGEDPTNDPQATDANGNLALDFGFHNGLQIGSLVWLDDTHLTVDDENGIADAIEDGITGVTVDLYADNGDTPGEFDAADTLIDSTVTGVDGYYGFDHLVPGDYIVVLPADQFGEAALLDNLISTLDGSGDQATDNDDNGQPIDGVDGVAGIGLVSNVFTLDYGDQPTDDGINGTTGASDDPGTHADQNSNLTNDFGLVELPLYRIGNLVWEDVDDDGIAQADEPGIPGVLVQLVAADATGEDVVVGETVTDADGHYVFDNLLAGDYSVVIPADQTPTLGDQPDLIAGALDGHTSSDIGEEVDPNGDVDNNDNGILDATTGNLVAADVSVGEGLLSGEPTDETLRADDATDDDLDGPTGWPDHRSNLSVDFGFYQLTLGDQVWYDVNGDGVQDDGSINPAEPGINGVTVELYEVDPAGGFLLIDTTETANINGTDGAYVFTGLENGGEYVVVIPEEEFADGEPLYGTYSSPDADDGTTPVDPDGDETVPNDGVDGDDSGIDQVEETPDPTDDAGKPVVGDIESQPVTLWVTDEPLGEVADSGSGVDDGNENQTVDFGFVGLTLGNLVWLDANEDGIADGPDAPDGAEPGLADVIVELWAVDAFGNLLGTEPLATTTTDADGAYEFVALEPGDYVVTLSEENFSAGGALLGMVSTAGNGVTSPDVDDDPTDNDDNGNPVVGDDVVSTESITSDPISLGFAEEPSGDLVPGYLYETSANLTADFGLMPTPPMSVGNLIWHDVDNDGVVDDDEVGIADVTVELWSVNAEGNLLGTDPVDTTTTDVDGFYLFTDVAPGGYLLMVPAENFDEPTDALAGFHSSTSGTPTDPDDDVDGDDNTVDPETPGEDVLTEPFTLYPTLEPTGDAETLLGPDGHGTVNDGSPDGDPIDDFDSNLTVDMGFYYLAVGNLIFHDLDNSGTFDEDEPGLPDVELELWQVDAGGALLGTDPIATTTTDADGFFDFSGFPAGGYLIMAPAENFEAGGALLGMYSSTGNGDAPSVDDEIVDGDDNGDPVDGPGSDVVTGMMLLEPGTEPTVDAGDEDGDAVGPNQNLFDASANLTADLGFYTASLGAFLWIDLNNDGVFDPDEDPIAGVTVELYDAFGNLIATAVSDEDGLVEFTGLQEGLYGLLIIGENFEEGGPLEPYVSTGGNPADDDGIDPIEEDGGVASQLFNITAGGSLLAGPDASFGFTPEASVGDTVFRDNDRDGIQDSGEPGIADVTVKLYDESGEVVRETTTDADGVYIFKSLTPGDYTVEFETPTGLEPSPKQAGSDTAVDSDMNPATGRTDVITLVGGAPNLTVDAGFMPPGLGTPPENLAFSGSETDWLVVNGLLALAIGLQLYLFPMLLNRRRRRTEA